MVFYDRVVGGPVVRHQEGPAPLVAVVLLAAVEQVTVEKQGVTRLQLNMHQGEKLLDLKFKAGRHVVNLIANSNKTRGHSIIREESLFYFYLI